MARTRPQYMVYVLIDPRDMAPFYVGMTCRPAARWANHHHPTSSACPRLRELDRLGLKCRVRIAEAGLFKEEALHLEAILISAYRRTLVNRTAPPMRPLQAAA